MSVASKTRSFPRSCLLRTAVIALRSPGVPTGTRQRFTAPGLQHLVRMLVAAILLLLCLALPGSSQGSLRSTEFMSAANDGFAKIYNLDFDAAGAVFTGLAKRYPDHPAPPLYQATLVWLRYLDDRHELALDRFVHPEYFTHATTHPMDPAAHAQFLELVTASRTLAERRLKTNPQDEDARYYRGAGEGLAAAFSITVDRSYLGAFRHGQQAYAIESRLMQDDGRYFDASMLAGLYDYIGDEVPWYLRWLASGNKARGLQSVNLTVEKGAWISDGARIVRLAMLAREGRQPEALADAMALSGKYPRNYQFQIARAQLLDRMGRREEADNTYLQILRFAEEGKPNYQRLKVAALSWEFANRQLATQPQAALARYQSLISNTAVEEKWRVMALLQSGCALDLLGRREEAVRQYRAVLGMKEYENSHAHASRYLQAPFSVSGRSIALPRISAE